MHDFTSTAPHLPGGDLVALQGGENVVQLEQRRLRHGRAVQTNCHLIGFLKLLTFSRIREKKNSSFFGAKFAA